MHSQNELRFRQQHHKKKLQRIKIYCVSRESKRMNLPCLPARYGTDFFVVFCPEQRYGLADQRGKRQVRFDSGSLT
jgi:hypothetical protein